jgi:hypothetical protein
LQCANGFTSKYKTIGRLSQNIPKGAINNIFSDNSALKMRGIIFAERISYRNNKQLNLPTIRMNAFCKEAFAICKSFLALSNKEMGFFNYLE